MVMKSLSPLLLAVIVGLAASTAEAQTADRAFTLFEIYRQSVVKITVSGNRPFGEPRHEQGTGFVVAYSAPFLYVVTAGHVVGSGAARQQDNADWHVQDGNIKRTIRIAGFDQNGFWRELGGRVEQVPLAGEQNVDLALLVVTDGPELAPIPLMRAGEHATRTREVMLMGFRGASKLLTSPIPIGNGAQKSLYTYETSVASRQGESGGPWIDLKSGGVIAVVSRLSARPEAASWLAIPADLVANAVDALLRARGASARFVGDEDVTSFPELLRQRYSTYLKHCSAPMEYTRAMTKKTSMVYYKLVCRGIDCRYTEEYLKGSEVTETIANQFRVFSFKVIPLDSWQRSNGVNLECLEDNCLKYSQTNKTLEQPHVREMSGRTLFKYASEICHEAAFSYLDTYRVQKERVDRLNQSRN